MGHERKCKTTMGEIIEHDGPVIGKDRKILDRKWKIDNYKAVIIKIGVTLK